LLRAFSGQALSQSFLNAKREPERPVLLAASACAPVSSSGTTNTVTRQANTAKPEDFDVVANDIIDLAAKLGT
jgi:hypothetical protein